MKIIIAGAGVIGSNLAKELSRDHEVYLIESDRATAAKVEEKLDVKVVEGNGSDPSVLTSVPIHNADLVIAATTSDETNVVVCSLAGAYGAKYKVARVRNASLTRALERYRGKHFDIDEIINPEELAAKTILRSLKTPGAREVADFAEGRILFRVFNIAEKSPLDGMKLSSLQEEEFPWPFLIVAVMRNGEVFFPKGDTILQAEDRIYVLLPVQSAAEFLTFVDPDVRRYKKAVIYGAGQIGLRLATLLSSEMEDILLLDERAERAEEAAAKLDKVRVIQGSACESDILKESGIETTDAFIAVTEEDHLNLVSAVLAKKMGAKTTIITTAAPDFMTVVDCMNIDAVINPRFLAVDQILRFVRGKGISAVSSFAECDAEALELVPEEGSPVTLGPLKKIGFPKDSIVGAVFRNNEVVLAHGELSIQAGEKVIVFCREAAVQKIRTLFTKKHLF